ncbi:MAG: type VI secretion system ImpA family N-terminal domain-containing protein, partial [Pseudomonadota bacterium]|nr:type VI secretion system ImpA family N-terminal domain-containing protein [Pseudomonadota bacterium]
MPLDLSALSLPLPGDAPSGENLEYDAAYAELEIASQPVEERVIGDSVLAAQDPDWDEVARLASGLLARTRDLRIAVTLANAALRLDGLPGFAAVLGYMAESLETHWDSVHPQLDPDDDDDPTMRVNAVLGLADPATTLRALRLAPLTDSRGFGRFHLRDMLVADGEATAPDGAAALDPQTIFAAFQDTPPERLAEITAAADAILAHARAISAAF